MKLSSVFPAILAALIAFAPTAHAQQASPAQVNIPFAFDCGIKHFAAGTYRLSHPTTMDGVITLTGTDGRAVFALGHVEDQPTISESSYLIFTRSGKNMVLRQVWQRDSELHLDLQLTRQQQAALRERQVAEDARPENIRIQIPGESVLVASNSH